jgi:hypothetical protein
MPAPTVRLVWRSIRMKAPFPQAALASGGKPRLRRDEGAIHVEIFVARLIRMNLGQASVGPEAARSRRHERPA